MVISEDVRARIDVECARLPEPRGALLSALRLVQDEHGHVSRDAALEVAEIFAVLPVEVLELVGFYDHFTQVPTGRHRVAICAGLSCALRGATGLARALASHASLEVGQTSRDGRIELAREECVGACALAPVVRIDGEYHTELDADRAVVLVDALE